MLAEPVIIETDAEGNLAGMPKLLMKCYINQTQIGNYYGKHFQRFTT